MISTIASARLATFGQGDSRQRGFSLYELMVSLGIVGTLAVSAVGFGGVIQGQRITAQVNELVGHLSFARSEAIKRGTSVTVCSSRDSQTCAVSTNWSTGWIVFADSNGDGDVDETDAVLRVQDGADRISLRYRAFGPGAGRFLTYEPSGLINAQNGTFTFCDTNNAARGRTVILNKAGRPRVSNTAANGQSPSCAPAA